MIFMSLKNNRGAAMPTVIMVMVVLFILGMALLNVSSADVAHASVQHRKTQAHYLARSGAYVGYGILTRKLNDQQYLDLGLLVSSLNAEASTINPVTIAGIGTFNVSFEHYSNREVKIISTGVRSGTPSSSDVVTLRVKISLPGTMDNFPNLWYAGINLVKGVTPLTAGYLGQGVMLEGNPTSSPMGSGSSSVYQASIFYFSENIKKNSPADSYISLRQITNTIPVTFDGEVIYFVGRVLLNSRNDPIYLSLSNEAALNKIIDPDSILYVTSATVRGTLPASTGVGFENYEYYKYFLEGNTYDRHNQYTFTPNTRYGVVYFGKNIISSSGTNQLTGNKYYFFPDGIDIKKTVDLNKLIPILPDDGIIKALEDKFKLSRSSEPYLWERE
jgi:hypothetical protein